MLSVNKVILIGNLGRDPEIRFIDGNIKVAKLAVATNERYTLKNGNRIDTTEWHIVNLWRGLADIAEKGMKKGSKVYIEGKLRTREYTDKEGNKRRSTEIEGESVLLLDRKIDDGSGTGYNNSYNHNTYTNTGNEQAKTHENEQAEHTEYSPPEQGGSVQEDDLPF